MKIKINRDSFQKVFQIAAAVAPTRSPKAILQNVKIDVSKSDVILTATDTEVGVRMVVPDVEITSPGSAVVPVSRLSMILRESSDEQLEIEADADKTLILGKSSRFELQGQNPDEFPEVAGFDEKDYFELEANVLQELIRRTLFATDAESSRYALGWRLAGIGRQTGHRSWYRRPTSCKDAGSNHQSRRSSDWWIDNDCAVKSHAADSTDVARQ